MIKRYLSIFCFMYVAVTALNAADNASQDMLNYNERKAQIDALKKQADRATNLADIQCAIHALSTIKDAVCNDAALIAQYAFFPDCAEWSMRIATQLPNEHLQVGLIDNQSTEGRRVNRFLRTLSGNADRKSVSSDRRMLETFIKDNNLPQTGEHMTAFLLGLALFEKKLTKSNEDESFV